MHSQIDPDFEALPLCCELQLPADPAATARLGRELGGYLRCGDVLALVGDLGAGKTTLVRGLARGLAVDDPDGVASPTYLLVIEHPGPTPLRHADAYLPDKLSGFLDDGGLDYLMSEEAVVAVEWADRVGSLMPRRALWLRLDVKPNASRSVELRCRDPQDFPWLGQIGRIDWSV